MLVFSHLEIIGQELIDYRQNDVYIETIKSTFFNSSIRTGGAANYQFRNFFPNKDLFFVHFDNNLYFYRGDSTFPGFHVDYEYTFLSNSDSIIPTHTNKLALTGYMDMTGGYKFGLIRYDFPDQIKYEWTIEFVLNIFELASAGFIFARNVTDETHYYQLGYRYNMTALLGNTYSRNLIQLGWALSRAKFPDSEGIIKDRWSKLKFELIFKRFFRKLPPITFSTSVSRDYREKIWYWQLGTLVDLNVFSEIWIRDD